VNIVILAVRIMKSMYLLVTTVLSRVFSLRPQPAPAVVAHGNRRAVIQPVTQMSAEAHWVRVSAVVARSVDRAHDINEQQNAARQQLDAAEYTLHRLIEELNSVMTSPVQLPRRADVVAPTAARDFVQAMAA
jgi:ClpP class serine protease